MLTGEFLQYEKFKEGLYRIILLAVYDCFYCIFIFSNSFKESNISCYFLRTYHPIFSFNLSNGQVAEEAAIDFLCLCRKVKYDLYRRSVRYEENIFISIFGDFNFNGL